MAIWDENNIVIVIVMVIECNKHLYEWLGL